MLEGPSDITSLQFHPKGHVLLAAGEDGTIWLWSLPSGNCMSVLSTDTFAVLKAKFYPFLGKNIVSTHSDGNIKIWDPKSNAVVAKYSTVAPANSLYLYESNPDGKKFIIAGCEDGHLYLLHGTTCVLLEENNTIHENSIEVLSIAEKGKTLFVISGCLGGKLAIFEMPSLTVRNICDHPSGITALQVISSGTFFVAITGSTDGIIRVWDIVSGALIRTFKGHQDTILDITYIESRFADFY